MNKAAGEVCSTVSDSHRTVYEHFEPEVLSSNGAKLHSVGRLDCDTEGLLIFTNDGKLSDFLTRPENKIEKTYFVRLKNLVTEIQQKEYAEQAELGVTLPPDKKSPEQKSNGAKITWLSANECEITLTEGKFHEVKRIFRALGNEVIYLKRIKFAGLELDENLETGTIRPLYESELFKLKTKT
jgi:16S rRNA pseudouridine516 synthase